MKTTMILASTALDHAPPWLVDAISLFREVGQRIYVAAPLSGDGQWWRARLGAEGLLPLWSGQSAWATLLNSYRVSHWARGWRPECYLSLDPLAALAAHSGRGRSGGYGLSVLWLDNPPRGWLATHAFREADRLIVDRDELATQLIAHHHARGGDLTVLPNGSAAPLVAQCMAFFDEPPGVLG